MGTYSDALAASAVRIAIAAVVSDIEMMALRVHLTDGHPWYDVRAMLDPREQPPQIIDMTSEALAFGFVVGVISTHPDYPHLVRVHHRCHMPATAAGQPQH